jgi:hypothetical protein
MDNDRWNTNNAYISALPRADRMAVTEVVRHLVQSMADGKKIDAIKAFRTLTGDGLKESKDAVERVTDRFVSTRYGLDEGREATAYQYAVLKTYYEGDTPTLEEAYSRGEADNLARDFCASSHPDSVRVIEYKVVAHSVRRLTMVDVKE